MHPILSRRTVLKSSVVTAVAWLLDLVHFDQFVSVVRAEDCSHGELYAGFLLLQGDDPLPSCVDPPEYLPPNVCGVSSPSQADAVPTTFDSPEQMASVSTFTIYTVNSQ
jgi:hypothetical protein